MSENKFSMKIQLKRDELSNWQIHNPVLLDGELGVVKLQDGTRKIKVGNGLSSFLDLDYLENVKIQNGVWNDEETQLSDVKNLKIINISEESFLSVIDSGKYDPSILYIISSDNLNAYGRRLLDVADPVLTSDGANKKYVDDFENSLSVSYLSSQNVLKIDSRNRTLSTLIPQSSSSKTTIRIWNDEFGTVLTYNDGSMDERFINGEITQNDLI